MSMNASLEFDFFNCFSTSVSSNPLAATATFNALMKSFTMNSSISYSNPVTTNSSSLGQFWSLLFHPSMSDWELTLRLTAALFLWHQIVFIGRYVPYWICDQIDYFKQYKIQKDKPITNEQYYTCIKQMILEQVFLQLPLMFGFKKTVDSLGMDLFGLPTIWQVVSAISFFLLVEDTCAYFLHRALHWGPLYKHIHKFHHTYTAPFGLAAEYGHPAETLLLGIGFTSGPTIWSQTSNTLHVFTMFVWLTVRLVTTVDTHSGYDFPWAIHHFFPLWSGADHHDLHHQKFVGNYAGTFRHWDWIMGTDFASIERKLKAKKSQ